MKSIIERLEHTSRKRSSSEFEHQREHSSIQRCYCIIKRPFPVVDEEEFDYYEEKHPNCGLNGRFFWFYAGKTRTQTNLKKGTHMVKEIGNFFHCFISGFIWSDEVEEETEIVWMETLYYVIHSEAIKTV